MADYISREAAIEKNRELLNADRDGRMVERWIPGQMSMFEETEAEDEA